MNYSWDYTGVCQETPVQPEMQDPRRYFSDRNSYLFASSRFPTVLLIVFCNLVQIQVVRPKFPRHKKPRTSRHPCPEGTFPSPPSAFCASLNQRMITRITTELMPVGPESDRSSNLAQIQLHRIASKTLFQVSHVKDAN